MQRQSPASVGLWPRDAWPPAFGDPRGRVAGDPERRASSAGVTRARCLKHRRSVSGPHVSLATGARAPTAPEPLLAQLRCHDASCSCRRLDVDQSADFSGRFGSMAHALTFVVDEPCRLVFTRRPLRARWPDRRRRATNCGVARIGRHVRRSGQAHAIDDMARPVRTMPCCARRTSGCRCFERAGLLRVGLRCVIMLGSSARPALQQGLAAMSMLVADRRRSCRRRRSQARARVPTMSTSALAASRISAVAEHVAAARTRQGQSAMSRRMPLYAADIARRSAADGACDAVPQQ